MLTIIKLDGQLLEDIGTDASSFIGKIIDISEAPESLSSCLNIEWASSFGVTKQDLSTQVAENRIREISSRANIQVVCFFKEQVEKETVLLDQLRIGRLVLLK